MRWRWRTVACTIGIGYKSPPSSTSGATIRLLVFLFDSVCVWLQLRFARCWFYTTKLSLFLFTKILVCRRSLWAFPDSSGTQCLFWYAIDGIPPPIRRYLRTLVSDTLFLWWIFFCYMRIVFTYADKQRFMWCHFEVGQGGNFAFQYPDGWLVNKRKIFSLVEIYNTTSTIQCRPKSIEYTTKRSDFNTNTNAFEWKYCAQLM